jgi:nucleoside-diphosphate-sugar epimerase
MIYLTGASGYLGQHIMRLGGSDVVPVPRENWSILGRRWYQRRVVIHAAWPMPPATDMIGLGWLLTECLVDWRPSFVVFVSTRAEGSEYADQKRAAEELLTKDPPFGLGSNRTHVVRFPGLYGPPRRSGLMYNATRAMLRGESFWPDQPLPEWTAMRVEMAARICLDLARAEKPGLTIARDEEFEEWLTFCRASS